MLRLQARSGVHKVHLELTRPLTSFQELHGEVDPDLINAGKVGASPHLPSSFRDMLPGPAQKRQASDWV